MGQLKKILPFKNSFLTSRTRCSWLIKERGILHSVELHSCTICHQLSDEKRKMSMLSLITSMTAMKTTLMMMSETT